MNWINLKDERPKYGEHVLIKFYDNEEWCDAYYYGNGVYNGESQDFRSHKMGTTESTYVYVFKWPNIFIKSFARVE